MVVLDLRNRPLQDTALDRRRFVDRGGDREAILKALTLRFNVLLVAPRGAGASTFFAHLPRAATQTQQLLPPMRYVSAARARDPAAVLGLVARALDENSAGHVDERDEDTALEVLAGAVERHGAAVVLLDGLGGVMIHAVFGRMRDELWALGDLHWVVAVPADEELLALTPPGDQFFETVHHLTPMSDQAIMRMLALRDPDGQLPEPVRAEIAQASAGNPSVALRLARARVAAPDSDQPRVAEDVVGEISARLGEPAARLAAELSRAGSSGPSDEGLLRRLGWSRPRAYEVFRLLEQSGYLASAAERDGRPGRPRKLYRLKDAVP